MMIKWVVLGDVKTYSGEGEWGCLKFISYATDSIIFKLSSAFYDV